VQVERRCREGRDEAAAAAEPTTSWHSLALTCPRTCALCDDASPRTCRLPGAWHGRWTDAATGAAVAINATAMSVVNERKHEFLLRVFKSVASILLPGSQRRRCPLAATLWRRRQIWTERRMLSTGQTDGHPTAQCADSVSNISDKCTV